MFPHFWALSFKKNLKVYYLSYNSSLTTLCLPVLINTCMPLLIYIPIPPLLNFIYLPIDITYHAYHYSTDASHCAQAGGHGVPWGGLQEGAAGLQWRRERRGGGGAQLYLVVSTQGKHSFHSLLYTYKLYCIDKLTWLSHLFPNPLQHRSILPTVSALPFCLLM